MMPATFSSNGRLQRWWRTPKAALTVVFAILFVVAGAATGWSVVLPHMLAAVVTACATDLIATALLGRRLAWPSSALLSGAIVGFVLAPDTPLLVTAWVAALATCSKYVLRTPRGHIFNPAALALVASIPLFATGQSWWGAGGDLAWPFVALLLLGGVFVVDRINKFPLVLSFAAVYFAGFTLVGLVAPTAAAEMFRAPFVQATLFLGFFMLTDPPTSPGRHSEQVWIGALAALCACGAQLAGLGQAYLLVGVLAGNAALTVTRALRSVPAPRPASSLLGGGLQRGRGTY
jgi:Na+-translocating ferredoxin:NAD+ oxidoreductase RnfD subunit